MAKYYERKWNTYTRPYEDAAITAELDAAFRDGRDAEFPISDKNAAEELMAHLKSKDGMFEFPEGMIHLIYLINGSYLVQVSIN